MAVINEGAVAESVKVAVRAPSGEIFHRVNVLRSALTGFTGSTITPSTLTAPVVAETVSEVADINPASQIFPSLSEVAAIAI